MPKSASYAVLSRMQITLFMRLAEHLTALRASCKHSPPGRRKRDVLRPGMVGMRGSMVIRLRPCMIVSTPSPAKEHTGNKTGARVKPGQTEQECPLLEARPSPLAPYNTANTAVEVAIILPHDFSPESVPALPCFVCTPRPSQTTPHSQAKPGQARPSQAKPNHTKPRGGHGLTSSTVVALAMRSA